MTSAVEKDGSGNTLGQANYVYDPFGNRVEESITDGSGNTTVTRYAYDAQAQTLWATLDGSGQQLVLGIDAGRFVQKLDVEAFVLEVAERFGKLRRQIDLLFIATDHQGKLVGGPCFGPQRQGAKDGRGHKDGASQ